jgi:hypothetical protein
MSPSFAHFPSRFWLRNLEETDPELAKQIHVFSSFFYKQLNKKEYVFIYDQEPMCFAHVSCQD